MYVNSLAHQVYGNWYGSWIYAINAYHHYVVSSYPTHGELYSIQHYVMKMSEITHN